jgi:hypothetical protein
MVSGRCYGCASTRGPSTSSGSSDFERFDAAVTEKVLDNLTMERQDDRDEMRQRVSALRCLPLQLSGGAMRSIARTPTRVKALYLCRDNIARFLKVHAETEGNMAIIMRQR